MITELRYCKENVNHIIQKFATLYRSVNNSKMTLKRIELDFPEIHKYKNRIHAVRKNPDVWHKLKEPAFRDIIRVLQYYDALDLKDNHLLLESINGYFFHAHNAFYESCDLDVQCLTGFYHCYLPSAIENRALLALCHISYDERSNSLKTHTVQRFFPENMEPRTYSFKGIIVRKNERSCYQIDQDERKNMDRHNNFKIIHRHEKIKSLEGWSQFTYMDNDYIRRIIMERCDKCNSMINDPYDDEELDRKTCTRLDYYPLNAPEIPKALRIYLDNSKNSSLINIVELKSRTPDHIPDS